MLLLWENGVDLDGLTIARMSEIDETPRCAVISECIASVAIEFMTVHDNVEMMA